MTKPSTKTGTAPAGYYSLISGATATEGSIAVINSSGAVKNAELASGLSVIGVFEEVRLDGTLSVEDGIKRLANSTSSAITRADRNKAAYVEDADTVRKTAGSTPIVAGLVIDVDSEGVWVDMTPQGITAANAIIATSFTQAATQADPVDLVNSTGGTASGTHTLAAPAGSDYTTAELKNIVSTLSAEHNAVNTVVKGLIDKLQAAGLMA